MARLFITAGRIGQRRAAEEIAGLREQIPSLRTVAAFGAELPRNPLGKILKRELRDELRH